jgi:hypothetical protein
MKIRTITRIKIANTTRWLPENISKSKDLLLRPNHGISSTPSLIIAQTQEVLHELKVVSKFFGVAVDSFSILV